MAVFEAKDSDLNSSSRFGISLACHRGDYPLLKGCCASIRENLPRDIPLCVIRHGDFSVRDLEEGYGVTVLDSRDVDPRLHCSYGYGLTKMIAFWHSPFEHFLHIDADTVCWGDILRDVPWPDYDVIHNEPHEIITDSIQRSQYFDPDIVFKHLPAFNWQGQPYFNSGCFFARRGVLDLQEYLDLLEFQRNNPGAVFTDQGILNLMIFRRVARKQLTVRAWPLQAVVPVIPLVELHRRFRFSKGRPCVAEDDRRVIHWAGPKPYLTREKSFPEAMVHYRLEHLRHMRSPRRLLGAVGLMQEELQAQIERGYGGNYLRAISAKSRWMVQHTVGRAC